MLWKTEILEISNNVYQLTMTHRSGAKIEKMGTDIEALKKESISDSIKLEEEIKNKVKTAIYASLIQYLNGEINFIDTKNRITQLSNQHSNETDFDDFIVSRLRYEAYQFSIGKSELERDQIKQRLIQFLDCRTM